MAVEEQIKGLVQKIRHGLLETMTEQQIVEFLLKGLQKSCLEVQVEPTGGNGHIHVLPTETDNDVIEFFESLNEEEFISSVTSRDPIELAKQIGEILFELAKDRMYIKIMHWLELFLNELRQGATV